MAKIRSKGTGTVRKIGNKFYPRWRSDGKDVYGKACDTRDEAEIARINGQSQIVKVRKKDMPSLQIWAFLHMSAGTEQYNRYGNKIAKSTFQTSETIRLSHIENSKLGRLKLDRITDQDIQDWADSIQKKIIRYENGNPVVTGYAPASAHWVRRCYAFVSRLFTLAVKAKLIASSPCFEIELPEVPERFNSILTIEQATSLYQYSDRTGSMMILAADMGLRADEIRRITWADITDHGLKVTNQKNNNQKDLIPFTVEARQALLSQPKRSMFVFTTESGGQLSPRNMKRDVRARMRQIGIPDSVRPFQDLRGTFTTLLIQSGVDIKTTQMLARHSNAKTTIKSYLRTSDQAKSEAIHLMQKRKGVVNEGSEKDSISKSG